MSIKIGIVSEGVSDYQILKHIVGRYLKDLDINPIPLKPKQSSKGKQEGFGGWQEVFKYISGDDADKLIIEAVKEGCQYVVIQIDTDVCKEYGVSKNTEPVEVFWQTIKEKLQNSIHPDFPMEKLLFAICIHEIECWLIPFVSTTEKDCTNTDRCVNVLNKHIRSIGFIDKDNKNCDKAQRIYRHILDKQRKPKEIQACSEYNYGFKMFVDQLNHIR